ncbi:MAG: hypothetical protein PHX51_01950 [Clostridia bacterium]|nr:hypothetical protein [Clostridia bacterium]
MKKMPLTVLMLTGILLLLLAVIEGVSAYISHLQKEIVFACFCALYGVFACIALVRFMHMDKFKESSIIHNFRPKIVIKLLLVYAVVATLLLYTVSWWVALIVESILLLVDVYILFFRKRRIDCRSKDKNEQ